MRGGNAHGAARATARGRARAMMYAGTGAAHLAAAAQDRAEAGEPPAGQACTRSDARWDRWGQPLRAGARRRAAPGRGPREAAAQAEASRGTPCGTPLRPRPAGPRAPRLRSADLLHSRPRLGQSAPRAPYLRTTSGHRSLLALPARSGSLAARNQSCGKNKNRKKEHHGQDPAHGPAPHTRLQDGSRPVPHARRAAERNAGRDQEGLPRKGSTIPSRCGRPVGQRGRARGSRGQVQGGERCVRRGSAGPCACACPAACVVWRGWVHCGHRHPGLSGGA